MKSLAAAASTAIQLVYVWTLLGSIISAIQLVQVTLLYGSGDPKLVAGAISSIITVLLVGAVIGLIGVFLAWFALQDKKNRPSWFLPVTTFFAWTWMVFIPVGTVIGVLMLRWRRLDMAEKASDAEIL